MQIIKTKSSQKKNMLIGTIAAIVLIGIPTTFAFVNNIGPFATENTPVESTIDFEEPTTDQIDAGKQAKDTTVKSGQVKPGSSSSSGDPSVGSPSGNTVGVEITNTNITNDILSVKTMVQEINSAGVCTLTLSKTGQASVVKAAETQVSGNVATCQGFTLNVSSLIRGSWNLKIDYSSDKSNGTTSESVTL